MGEVIVGDIVLLVGVIVYNFGMYIVMLNDKGKLEVEFVVECGCGYVLVV